MKKLILFLLLAVGITKLLASDSTLIPYLSQTDYSDGSKSDSTIGGLYYRYSTATHTYELGFEKIALKFNDSNTSDLKQDDITFVYSYQMDKNYKLKTGLHYILSNESYINKTTIFLLGLGYIEKKSFKLGANLAISLYSSSALASKIIQLKPYYGFTYGERNSVMGKFYTKFNMYIIHPKEITTSLKHTYYSYELELNHSKGNFTNKVSGWIGEQLYALRDNGFTVYNLNEEHNGGFSISSRYSINSDIGLKLAYVYEDFNEIGSTTATIMNRIVLSCDVNF